MKPSSTALLAILLACQGLAADARTCGGRGHGSSGDSFADRKLLERYAAAERVAAAPSAASGAVAVEAPAPVAAAPQATQAAPAASAASAAAACENNGVGSSRGRRAGEVVAFGSPCARQQKL
jgi:hypothetical protein